MRRTALVWFALLLAFSLTTSVIIAQRLTPVSLATANDCGDCLPTATPHSSGQGAHSGDADGDGIPNGIDQCPNQGGPSSNSGCPPGTGPAAVAQPAAPLIALPTMPFTGDCVLATSTSEGVNIRIQPSTSAEIVGVLDPQMLYPVNGQNHDTEVGWEQIDEGWVARRVVRLGGDCSLLPEVALQVTGTGLHVTQVPISCDIQELIDAIKNASSGATIVLAPGCIYTLTQAYGDINYGLPRINITLTIIGNGATIRRSSAAGTPWIGIFYVAGGSLTLNSLTLRNGAGSDNGCSPCFGGAILNDGSLVLNHVTFSHNTYNAIGNRKGGTVTVTDSTFSNNTSIVGIIDGPSAIDNMFSHICGGAIENDGTLTVANSTFSDNSASTHGSAVEGGAICNQRSGTLTVTNSTFTDNSTFDLSLQIRPNLPPIVGGEGGAIGNEGTMSVMNSTFSGNGARRGGGISNDYTATVSNSTFSGNLGVLDGGAISNNGVLTLTNSTIASNTVDTSTGSIGGGIDNGSILVVGSSIVSRNDGDDLHGGTITSLGYNIIGSISGTSISGNTTHDLTNAAASPLHLGALADNGGPTQTMALSAGSVAIGAGNCATFPEIPPVTTDQRGSGRKPTCDAGAYEYLPDASTG